MNLEIITGMYFYMLIMAILIYLGMRWEVHKNKYKNFYSLPSPTPNFPIFGNIILFKKLKYNIVKIFEYAMEKVGSPCLLYMPHRAYLTSSPEEFKIILNHPDALEKGAFYKVFNKTFGETLLLESVHPWKTNRKLLSKGFNQKVLNNFVATFYNCSNRLVNKLKNNDDKDLAYLLHRYTWDNFTENFFECKMNSLDDETNEFVDMILKGQTTMGSRIGNIIKMNDFLYNFTEDGKYLDRIMKRAFAFIQGVVSKKRLEWSQEIDEEVFSKELKRLPLLKLLISKEEIPDKYIREEMVLFAAAATDTTAYSIAYTCILLALHPDIQEKVYKEVINIVGKDREIDFTDLPLLKYTEMAINEALRLLPVIPMIGRKSTADIDLGTRVIPANTDIICFIYGTHRNKKYWRDPKKYNPDRFLPEEVAKRPQCAFIPFSGGPRNCIGWKYAMIAMQTTISNIVRHFHITTNYKSIDDMDFESSIAMSPTHPLDCHFKIRK
ncbi:unnamed protein product [Brassicogethes aeneus]|uniref:Cytochrome P450 n=1 Tax=Brassicogethes aeneus TaxID=1431903 RepID=A0A9P0FI49_BRAAE|nr:unnamed protein product [Brassicogethes aeneus]